MSQSFDGPPFRAILNTLVSPPRHWSADPPALRRMHFNEGAWPPSPRVAEAIVAAVPRVGRYGEAYGGAFAAAIAKRTGLPHERIFVGNGSGELIAFAGFAFIEPGRNGIVAAPSFPRLGAFVRIAGGTLKAVRVRRDGGSDIEAMLGAVDTSTSLLWIATPNNPTGAAASADELRHVARSAPQSVMLAVDAAYGEFSHAAGGPDVVEVLRGIDRPWFVLRTMSKAYGLAGLRVGYGLASSAQVAEAFHRIRPTFNVNAMALAGAAAAYDDHEYMSKQVLLCLAERDRLRARLADWHLECLPSAANFLAIELPIPGKDAVAAMREAGILVSEIKAPGYERYLRVTIGLPDDNAAFAAALARIVNR